MQETNPEQLKISNDIKVQVRVIAYEAARSYCADLDVQRLQALFTHPNPDIQNLVKTESFRLWVIRQVTEDSPCHARQKRSEIDDKVRAIVELALEGEEPLDLNKQVRGPSNPKFSAPVLYYVAAFTKPELLKTARLLLERRANPDYEFFAYDLKMYLKPSGGYGESARLLYSVTRLAAEKGSMPFVKLLNEFGANFSLPVKGSLGDEDTSVIELARKRGHHEVADFMETAMATRPVLIRGAAATLRNNF